MGTRSISVLTVVSSLASSCRRSGASAAASAAGRRACVRGAYVSAAHDLPEQHDVLASDHVEAERHVGEALADDHTLLGVLEHDVGELVERPQNADDLSAVAQDDDHLLCAAHGRGRRALRERERVGQPGLQRAGGARALSSSSARLAVPVRPSIAGDDGDVMGATAPPSLPSPATVGLR